MSPRSADYAHCAFIVIDFQPEPCADYALWCAVICQTALMLTGAAVKSFRTAAMSV
ncbi:MAG: hypothetical protein IKU46_04680 [Peptococcaceae bacterium]|nr:hypothetical protein [Peptococcaceae bacterium]